MAIKKTRKNSTKKMGLSASDYRKILKFYKLSIPKKVYNLRKKGDKIIAKKFCSCIKKVRTKFKKEGIAIGICTKSVITRKGIKRGKFNCKKRRSVKLFKGGSKRCTKKNKKTRKKRGGRGSENDLCAICQRELPGVSTRNNSSTIILSCGHRFHTICLIPWIDTCTRNNNPPCCPLCRGTISNNDLPEGTAQPQAAPEGNHTFVTDDGFDMNTLDVIRTSINYDARRGVLSPLIGESVPQERDLYFLLIRTVVQLGTRDDDFTAQNVLGIYYNIRTQYNSRDGVPSTETSLFQAMNDDIGILEGWIMGHNQLN